MSRKFFRRYAPSHQQVRNHPHLKMFGALICDPNLWYLNRRSVSGAFFVGLFWAFIPIPMQMLASVGSAILLRVNLPISLVLVWITNPITIPPIFYINYIVGSWLLNTPPVPDFELTMSWIAQSMAIIWRPLIAGSIVCGLVVGGAGFLGVRLAWRLHIVSYCKQRAERSRLRKMLRKKGDSQSSS
jgi:uncharacterized protein (DUF2062 family)